VDDIMYFIGLLLVALALFSNLKAYPNVFASKKKRALQEKTFEEAMKKIDETPVGERMTKGLIDASAYISLFFSFLFYLITSIVISNPFVYALAVVIMLLNIVITKSGAKAISERKFVPTKFAKLALPLKTLYIIGFFILFFL
jgi:hypothetical protein